MDDALRLLLDKGNFDDALALASRRLADARAGGDDAMLAEALVTEARAQLAHGDRDDAVMTVDEAISRARQACGPSDARYAEALELGAEVAAAAGMPNTADARFRGALEVLEGAGVGGELLASTLFHHGLFRRSDGDIAGAVRAFTEVIERAGTTTHEQRYKAMALTELGFVAFDAGRAETARAFGDRALEIFLALRKARRAEVADAMSLVGRAALEQQETTVAIEFLEPACDIYGGCKGDVRARHAAALHPLGLARAAVGRTDDARSALLAAIDLYREGSPERIELEQTLLELARHQPPPR